ncbi:hypothetical protein [Paenibacillus sp. y28]|uniref:hypothetical protein n=1 Tax=Paenibacillus sp. y28 TaxID=3129110 RepID=UPI003016FCD1
MFKELEDFKKAAAQHQERLQRFSKELKELREERARATELYSIMTADDSAGLQEYSVSELSRAKRRVDELDEEITVAQERLERLQSSKLEQLEKSIQAATQAWEREAALYNAALEPVFDEVRAHRARMLLAIQKAGGIYAQAREVFEQLEIERSKAGLLAIHNVGTTDIRTLTMDTYEGGKLTKIGFFGGFDQLLLAYYQGEVPEWVEAYRE